MPGCRPATTCTWPTWRPSTPWRCSRRSGYSGTWGRRARPPWSTWRRRWPGMRGTPARSSTVPARPENSAAASSTLQRPPRRWGGSPRSASSAASMTPRPGSAGSGGTDERGARHLSRDVVEERAMLFAVCAPGIEPVLEEEVRALGLPRTALAGGVEVQGALPEVLPLNLWSRTATRVLVRVGEPFHATAFAELIRKASALPWDQFVRRGERVAFRVTCRKSRLYHSGAVEERLLAAVASRVEVQPAAAPGDDEESDAQ